MYIDGMEPLKRFLSSLTVAQREEFAERCRTSWPFLRNISYGYRVAGEKLCVRIERESFGAVTRRDLRPDDWHEIWPELAEQEAPHA